MWGLLIILAVVAAYWVIGRLQGRDIYGFPLENRRGVRRELWHPESPGVRVTVKPGLPRRLGLVREPFATSREMKSVYEMNARRGDPRRAAQERVLSADEVRELEWTMGIGPFAGKENWCDPAKECYHRDHGPIDEETGLWEVVIRPTKILMPDIKEPLVAKEYKPGQLPEVIDIGVKEVGLKDLTVAQATKLMMDGVLPRSALAELLGEPQAYATGVAPNRKVNPNFTKWKGIRALERAEQLAQEGRPPTGYCTSSLHEHVELMTMDGVVRRRCENY